jgi:prefoldin subunit 5
MNYTHQCDAKLPEWLSDLAVKEAAPKEETPPPAGGEAPPPAEEKPAKKEKPAKEDTGTNEPVGAPAGDEAPPADAAPVGDALPPPPAGGDAPPPAGDAAPAEEPKKGDEGEKTEEEKTTDVGTALDKLKKQLDDLNKSMKEDVEKSVKDTAEKFNKQVGDVTTQIDALKGQITDLSKEKDIEEQLKTLQKRLDNLNVPTDADMNDSLNQTASKIASVQRNLRRLMASVKEAQETFEFEFMKGRDSYDTKDKVIVTEASLVGLKPGRVPRIVMVKNPKTGNSVKFEHYADDKTADGEDIAGFKYKATGPTWGVKELLIIND